VVVGWLSVGAGAVGLGLVAYALARRWTPPRWGGLYKHFAVGVGGVAVALIANGVSDLTTGAASTAARVVIFPAFLVAVAGLLGAHRVDRQARRSR
jgi:hypothetical protein